MDLIVDRVPLSYRLRSRPDSPFPVSAAEVDGVAMTLGVAHAVTLDAHSRPKVVVDWKSDVASATEVVAG